ncbi:hypothetical protein E4U41_002847 [Claviceps citrina]|nr:hypothetical protein E4U41_002847 [Claviceps citrina]
MVMMLSWKNSHHYDSVVSSDTADESGHEKDTFLPNHDAAPREGLDAPACSGRRPRLLVAAAAVTLLNVVLLLASIALVVLTRQQRRALFGNERNGLLKAVDAYSPVYDQIQVPLIDTTINGSLLDHGHSIYRQAPSAEVDAAWEAISHQLPHAISRDDVVRLGKNPARTARWPAEWGFGPDAYIAELDIVHTVHCLNAVRRDVHWRHYFGRRYPDGRFPALHRTHTDHCIYMILQNLMCGASGDMVTNVWVEGQSHPFPDFSINKRCRDHGALLDWHRRTQVTDMERFLQMRVPPGHVPWPMSQQFHDLFETGLKGGAAAEVLD